MADGVLASESAEITRLMDRVRLASGVREKAEAINNLFRYLAVTSEILKNARFRNGVKTIMLEFQNNPSLPPGTFDDSIRVFCRKLATYESGPIEACLTVGPAPIAAGSTGATAAAAAAAPTAAGAAASTSATGYEILGAGGFGAVFSPALPNTVDGVSTNYPGNVTKMFYGEEERNAAMNAVERLPAIMGVNKGHRAHRYSRKYRGSNLPPSLFALLRAKNPDLRKSTELYLMRMPHLGIDIEHIEGAYKEVRKRPFEHILKQIQKVIHQTATIASNNYAHFDIRPSNVMITPSTGDITIVDFDWLKSYDVLYSEYPLGFFSNPPESIFIKKMPIGGSELSEAGIRSFLRAYGRDTKLSNYEDQNLSKLSIGLEKKNINTKTSLHSKLMTANVENFKYLRSKGYTNIKLLVKEQFLPYVDNYGLGFTLIELIAHVYPFGVNGSTGEVTIDKLALASRIKKEGVPYSDAELDIIIAAIKDTIVLLNRMSSFKMEERPTPAGAAAEIDRIVSTAYPTAAAAPNAANANNNARRELMRMAYLAAPNNAANNAAANNAAANANNNASRELMRMAYLAGNTDVLRNTRRKNRKSRKARKARKSRRNTRR
jgi:serine/threonine protein kinase